LSRLVYRKPENHQSLATFLEGYLFGLGEVCHTLFGPQGETLVYRAIGRHYLGYLEEKMGIVFDALDSWERYCQIIEVFTGRGFYDYVELEARAENSFWMLENGQYAGRVWEEQGSWERGSPPCPLWSVILASLEQLDCRVVLDQAAYCQDRDGYESTFHFEKTKRPADEERPDVEAARQELIPICSSCSKIRLTDGTWMDIDLYLAQRHQVDFTHSLCSCCAKELYPDIEPAKVS
jgi:hypothetical protein